MYFDELDAAKEWGIEDPDSWFDKPRETRALIVAHMRLTGVVNMIAQYDANEEAERKAKAKRR